MDKINKKKEIIKLARESIKSRFYGNSNKKVRVPDDKFLKEKRGCFVTLTKHNELRGCIGFPFPVLPLGEAIVSAAKSAAFSDPRFPQLSEKEIPEIKIEISILSVPKEIRCRNEDFSENINIGKDGLICSYEGFSGLLLPQVAIEYNWNAEQFLRQLCNKAGLSSDSWKQPGFKLWKFQAEIIKEN